MQLLDSQAASLERASRRVAKGLKVKRESSARFFKNGLYQARQHHIITL